MQNMIDTSVHITKLAGSPEPSSAPREDGLDPSLPPHVRRDLALFREKVYAEMYALKDRGGRKHRITNGERIKAMGGGTIYTFDLESELFLAEDSPVSLTVGEKAVKGSVFACEEFKITLLLARDMGERITSAFISAEPWQLLESLGEHLSLMNPTDHQLAVKLMDEGPRLATQRRIGEVARGQTVAKQHVRENPITVIWGPPGTGKTHTMAEVAIECITQGKTVLVVSHSNISVDGVAAKVAEIMRKEGMETLLERGQVIRFGRVRDQGLTQDEDVVSYLQALNASPDLKKEMDDLYTERRRLDRSGSRDSDSDPKMTERQRRERLVEIQQRLKAIRSLVAANETYVVKHARLLATTVSKLYANSMFDIRKFDVVMFDEISMALIPQVLCAAMYARNKLVLVGDFRQLAPIVQSEAARPTLSRDLFSYLKIVDSRQQAYYHPWLVMLNEQRRMHPAIAAFPNKEYYGSLLANHESVVHGRDRIANAAPCPASPVVLVNLRGAYCPSASNADHSRFNILSGITSFGLAVTAFRDGTNSIGIITPYVAQAQLVRALLRDYVDKLGKKDYEHAQAIACSTVHQFQGSERDAIILDTVESYPAAKPGILTSKNVNGQVDRLINVAVTRARGKLITVANKDFWESAAPEGNAFAELLKHERVNDKYIGPVHGQSAEFLKSLDLGPNLELMDENSATDMLIKDINRTSQRVVLSIPDGKLLEPYASRICDAIRRARSRGLTVLIKCYNSKALPDDWKGLAWKSEDAIFPLVVLDGTICWYGMPPSRLRPTTNASYAPATTVRTPIRITGRHTVDMIWSLTGLESRKSDGNAQLLRERRGSTADDESGSKAYGLARYIKEHKKCPKCGAEMRLTKSYTKGSYYLRCTKDKTHIDYLRADDVNHYFVVSQARCPQCGATMQARLGRYGVYITCDGPAQHNVKPNEV